VVSSALAVKSNAPFSSRKSVGPLPSVAPLRSFTMTAESSCLHSSVSNNLLCEYFDAIREDELYIVTPDVIGPLIPLAGIVVAHCGGGQEQCSGKD